MKEKNGKIVFNNLIDSETGNHPMINKIYTHSGQEQMQVEVILASQHADHPNQKPLYTIRMRYPRIIHGEVMTHRDFSRNARSSRAVPVRTMLLECTSIPFVPWHWGKNQSGMQADTEHNVLVKLPNAVRDEGGFEDWPELIDRQTAWLRARDRAVETAEAFMNAGYHKQNVNRLLEPFSWIDVLITSNRWDNFLWLRDHKDAEPHLQDLARLVRQAIDEAEIQELTHGQWHLPYIDQRDHDAAYNYVKKDRIIRSEPTVKEINDVLLKISSARCARISYKPFDGDASYERELERYDMLVTSDRVHASPLEHQATPDTKNRLICDYAGEMDYADPVAVWANTGLHGNLSGWIQNRKLIPNEVYNG